MRKTLLSLIVAGVSFAGAAAEATPLTGRIAKAPADVDSEEWVTIGEGTFSDPVICNEYAGFYNDPRTVIIQQKADKSAIYRVLDPWGNIPEQWPTVTYLPERDYMVIDATDPGFVRVLEGKLPFVDEADGDCHFMSMNQFAYEVLGFDREQFINCPMGNCNVTLSDDGMITFPQNCFGVMYPEGRTVQPNTWVPTNGAYSGYLLLPGGKYEDDWELLGTGQMLDGFVWTIFEDEAPVEKDVEVYTFSKTEGIYKIVGAFSDTQENATDLILDARNPDFVIIEQFDTRINTQNGPLYILSVSANGYLDYESMVDANPEFANRNITLKDNYFDIPEKAVYLYFPEYDDTSVQVNGRSVASYIKLPGYVDNAVNEIDGDESAAEYYTLTGIRIAHPSAGEMVIERRGDKVRKILVK